MYWALFNGFSHFITRIKILLSNIQWLTIKNSNLDKEGLHLFLLSCYKCASLTVYVENLRSLRGAWKNYKFLSSEWWEKFEPPTIQNAMKFCNFAKLHLHKLLTYSQTLLYRRPLNTDTSILQTVWFIKKKRLGPRVNTQSDSKNSLFDYCIMFLYVTFLSMNDCF